MNIKLPPYFVNQDISTIFINISLILYPVTVLCVPKVNGVIFSLLVLMGLIFFIIQRDAAFKVNHDEKLLYLSIIVFFVVTFLITVYVGFVYKHIGKYLHILLAIPVYIYIRHTGVRLSGLWYGLSLGAIGAAGIAFYDVVIQGLPRAHGITHPIVFGDLALVMGFMSMASLGWFKQRGSWQWIIPCIALLSGLFASVLSQSRGGWIAIPIVVAVFFWFINSIFSFKLKVTLAALLLAALSVAYVVPQTGIRYQIERTINSLQQYAGSEITSSKRETSVGTRLEMWQASWKMFLDNPILGVGWGNYLNEAKLQVEQGLRNQSAATYDHPHSQYFTALASGGILGVVVTLMLFLVPAWLFFTYINQKNSEEKEQLALAGLLLIVCYMVFGLSEPLLDRSRSVNFFAFYLVVFMAAIQSQRR